MADFSVTLNITNNSSYDLTYDPGNSYSVDHAFFDPAPATVISKGTTGKIYIQDNYASEGAEGTVTYSIDTSSEKKYFQFGGSCPVMGSNYETGPGKTNGTGSSGHPVIGDFTIDDSTTPSWTVKNIAPIMPQIETIVFLMLENRSLDNVLGMLYAKQDPPIVKPTGSNASFDGVPLSNQNSYKGNSYSPSDGCASMTAPSRDPGEDFGHVQNQFYANGNGDLPVGLDWGTVEPTMSGFVSDYDHTPYNQEVMGSYNEAQLPTLYGLAQNYAVSDRWFCSIPTQTYCNRAFSICGTSLGNVDNSEIHGTSSVFHTPTFAHTRTVFNMLADAGKSWGFYWVDTLNSELAAGSSFVPHFEPFTPYYFPQMKIAQNGGMYSTDGLHTKKGSPFMTALQAGTLPNFCYLEPAWGGGIPPVVIQGTDMHPPANVQPGDDALRDLFDAIKTSPQWKNMLLIITFDEHGGTYDHVPPPATVAPDNSSPSGNTQNGFNFQRLGARVPTILVSPYISKGTVFRSEKTGVDYDHTSFIATLCKWVGVDPATAGMGARVAQAPTFENVLNTILRTDLPQLNPALCKVDLTGTVNPLTMPAPIRPNGQEHSARPIHFGDLHKAADDSKTPEEFAHHIRKLRYPK